MAKSPFLFFLMAWLVSGPCARAADAGAMASLKEDLRERVLDLAESVRNRQALPEGPSSSCEDGVQRLDSLLSESAGADALMAREALRAAARELDAAQAAVRRALARGETDRARALFMERFSPACIEVFILLDAARAAAGRGQEWDRRILRQEQPPPLPPDASP